MYNHCGSYQHFLALIWKVVTLPLLLCHFCSFFSQQGLTSTPNTWPIVLAVHPFPLCRGISRAPWYPPPPLSDTGLPIISKRVMRAERLNFITGIPMLARRRFDIKTVPSVPFYKIRTDSEINTYHQCRCRRTDLHIFQNIISMA